MANIIPQDPAVYSDIPQLEITDLALAGNSPQQVMNKQAQAIADRFAFVETSAGASRVGSAETWYVEEGTVSEQVFQLATANTPHVATLAELRDFPLPLVTPGSVLVLNYIYPSNAAAIYIWDAASTAMIDDIFVVGSNVSGTGRWMFKAASNGNDASTQQLRADLANPLLGSGLVAGAVGLDRVSPTVQALRLARENANNAQVTARITSFQQPIVHSPSVNERWRGVVRANGLHIHVPYDATTVLIHNPDTGEAYQTTFGLDLSGGAKWRGGVLGRDGRVYCVPYTATTVLVIDPVTLTATLETFGLATSALSAASKWDGGVLAMDGRIFCAPYNSLTMLVIDTLNFSAQVYTATQLGLVSTAFNNSAKYSGMVAIGTRVYGIPFAATNVLLVDVLATTATIPTYGLTLSDASKWARAIVYGNFIYAVPFNSTDILVIDNAAQTAVRTAMGATLTGNSKWRAIVRVGRKLYGIPGDAADFLVIDPLDTTGSAQGTATRTAMNVYDVRTPTTTGTMVATIKWSGAVVYKEIIYGSPCGSSQAGQDILLLDPAGNAGAGQAFYTDLRAYINGGGTGTTKWFGGVTHPNGYHYCIPASSVSFLIIKDTDPKNLFPTAVLSTLGLTLNSDPQKYQGGVLAGDGCIYAFPRTNATTVLKIDPSNTTASIYGTATQSDYGGARDRETGATGVPLTAGDGGALLPTGDPLFVQKWHSSVIGMDGKLYAIPYDVEKVLIMDIYAADAQKLELTNFGLNLVGISKWVGACLHPNGKIYCCARGSNMVLVIDTNPLSPTYNTAKLTNFGVDLNAGSNAGSTGIKWSFLHLGADGRMYGLPRSARNVLVIDPTDFSVSADGRATFETFGLNMTALGTLTGEGYTIAGKNGSDGKIYAACITNPPAGTGNFLAIDTITRTAKWQDYGLAGSLVADNKFAGAIHTQAGRIIFVPRNFGNAVVLFFANVPPLSLPAVLGPHLNKN